MKIMQMNLSRSITSSEMREKMIEAANKPAVIHYSERKPKKPVTIRVDDDDIDLLKKKAIEQGLQYQSLVCSVLHRCAVGTLVDVSEARKILSL